MSTKINLYFREFTFPQYEDLGIKAVRLFSDVIFKGKEEFTEPYPAIMDTGAPISLVPVQIWKECEVQMIRDSEIRGVVPRRECFLPVTLAEIIFLLVDQKNQSRELKIKTHLAYTDEVPLIIGLKDLLDSIRLHMDCKNKVAYLSI